MRWRDYTVARGESASDDEPVDVYAIERRLRISGLLEKSPPKRMDFPIDVRLSNHSPLMQHFLPTKEKNHSPLVGMTIEV